MMSGDGPVRRPIPLPVSIMLRNYFPPSVVVLCATNNEETTNDGGGGAVRLLGTNDGEEGGIGTDSQEVGGTWLDPSEERSVRGTATIGGGRVRRGSGGGKAGGSVRHGAPGVMKTVFLPVAMQIVVSASVLREITKPTIVPAATDCDETKATKRNEETTNNTTEG